MPASWEVGALPHVLIELQALYRHKFAPDILAVLQQRPLRYTDIQTHVTVAKKTALHSHTLSKTLDWLQQHGYIEHQQEDGAHYRLTPDGEEILRILGDINRMDRRRHNTDDNE
jgi:DNA-binding HxlR family transcriptional regulator